MKTRLIILAGAVLAVLLSTTGIAGQTAGTGEVRTCVGETRPMGNGFVRCWVTIDKTDKPVALGFTFNKAALSGLPSVDTEYPLALPSQVQVPPFNHLQAYWNAHGHIPTPIYGVPHFDFHFYMITPQERVAMVLNPQNMAKFDKAPPKEYLPQGYIFGPGSETTQMGSHWVDPNSPEFHGQPFTETFIYGSYDGHVTFVEPMMTNAFLETGKCVDKPIKQPQAYEEKGYYPTRYIIRYDPARDTYTVALQGLVYR